MKPVSKGVIRKMLLREKQFLSICPPFEVQPNWLIVPSEHMRRKVQPVADLIGRRVIQIYPGFIYGSGGNELTRAALHEIPRLVMGLSPRSARILDLGCGSGILALACARLGFKNVDGMDISRDAIRQARLNADTNGLKVSWMTKVNTNRTYDLIIANLFGHLFFDYIPVFKKILAPGGTIYGAGFDSVQSERLLPLYASEGFVTVPIKSAITRWPQAEWRRATDPLKGC